MINIENWKNINERYSVSNLGRIKSNYGHKEKILNPYLNRNGYLMVDIRFNGIRKVYSVHRLVAKTFLPNPNNLPEVNHKDEYKTNNCVENLEWCGRVYNCNYGTRNKRKAEGCMKKVYSIDKHGNILHYNSVIEASKLTGIPRSNISKALSNHYPHKTAGGKRWFYDK